jgi:hypothetical protein
MNIMNSNIKKATSTIAVVGFVLGVLALEAAERTSLAPFPKPDTATAMVDKDVQKKLSRVVILLTGETVQTRYVEEALTVQLLKRGVNVVSRLRVERLLAEEMVKNRTLSEKDPRKAIHATAIAKNAGASAILVGTVNIEPRVPAGQAGDRNSTVRLFKCISLQLVSVDTEDILWATCQEFDESVTYNEAANHIVASVKNE